MRKSVLAAVLVLFGCASGGGGPVRLPDVSGYGDYDSLGLCMKDSDGVDLADDEVAVDFDDNETVVYEVDRYCTNGVDPAKGVYESAAGEFTHIYHFDDGRETKHETYLNGILMSRVDRLEVNFRSFFPDGRVKEYNGREGFLEYYPDGNVFTKHKDVYTTYYGPDGKAIVTSRDMESPERETARYRMTKMYYDNSGELANGRFSIPCQEYPGIACQNFGVKDGRLNGVYYTFNPADGFAYGSSMPVSVSYYISGIENRNYDIVVTAKGAVESFERFYFGDSDNEFVKAYRGIGGRPALVRCTVDGEENSITGVSMMVMLENFKKDPTRNPCTGE
jgi:hypothetical protein